MPQPPSGGTIAEGVPCKQTTCGMAYCDGSRKFCGFGFDSANNLQYLTAAVASKPLNANPFICKNLPDKCSKEVCTVKGAAPDDSDTDADIEVYNSLCQPELIEGAACNDQNSCTTPDTCQSGVCSGTDVSAQCNDSNICTNDSCDPAMGCKYVNNSIICNDGKYCTVNDKCSGGSCNGAAKSCADTVSCTADSCNESLDKCVNTPNQIACNDTVACTIDSCDAISGCKNQPDNTLCNDSVACTDDQCDTVVDCKHTPNNSKCNDNVPCTNDICGPLGCANVPDSSKCADDGIACTVEECDVKNGCKSTPYDSKCNDNVECTDDSCGSGGCENTPNNTKCDDKDPCTIDSCGATGCVHEPVTCGPKANECSGLDYLTYGPGTCSADPTDSAKYVCNYPKSAKNCSDSNVCTDDSCNGVTGCHNDPNTNPCSDGNACTSPDVCSAGQCVAGGAINCDDGNLCTTDSCDVTNGCTNKFNTKPCDDSNACTLGDVCFRGNCEPGETPLVCNANAGDLCKKDSCDPATGCVVTNIADNTTCGDGNACNGDEVCKNGVCESSTQTVNCNDSNPCTIDSCVDSTGACTNEPNATFTCTDPANPWCDVGEESEPVCQYLQPTCHVISCEDLIISASKDPMPRYAVLYSNDPNYFSTLTPADEAALKDKICTGNGVGNVDLTTTYVPTFHCVVSQPPNQQFNNNQTAVQNDLKQESPAQAGDPLNYYMSFQYPDGVKNKTGAGDVVCTVELADITQTSVACSAPFTVNACATDANCYDSDPCTNDSCNADGTCSHADVICDLTQPSECVNGSYKTYSAGSCVPDDNDPTTYQCVYKEGLTNCDDGNDCTVDGCDLTQGGCVNIPAEGNFCSGPDKCSDYSCSESGTCQSSPKACPDADANKCTTEQCNATTGNCESVPSGAEGCCTDDSGCDDGHVCTTDSCNTATGACSHANVPDNMVSCNADDSLCTVDDKCVAGKCQPSSEKLACNANAGNPCKIDSCDPIQGCVAEDVPNGTACGDGNACDGDEVCENGSCVAGTNVDCDDSNRCTDDQCNILNGECLHQLATTAECASPPEWCDINAIEKVDQCTYKEPVCQVILCDDVIAKSEVKVPADMPAFFLLYSNNPDEFIDAATLADMKQKLCTGGQVVPVNLANMIVPTLTCDAKNTEGNIIESLTKDAKNIQDGDLNHFTDKDFPYSYQNQVPDSVMEKTGTGSIQCGVSLDFGNPAFTKNAQCSADFQIADCSSVADCDDSNPCTDDSCSASGSCVHINNASSCDDGNSCTVDDVCDEGKCESGAQKDCNDNSACTNDTCDQVTGNCANTPNGEPNCCKNDADCDDGNICTNNSCDVVTGKCSTTNIANWPGQMCDDLNACTLGDICTDGKCVGKGKDCNDGNNCSDDICDPAVGCTNTNNTNACDDKDACTTNDACTAGACAGGPAASCDDGNACTTDACDTASGCTHESITTCCNADADCGVPKDACTNLSCTNNECVETEKPDCCISDHDCPEVGPCQNKTCVNNVCGAEPIDNCCESNADCADDGDKCTDEFCDQDAHVCISQGECEEFCPDGVSKPKTCYLVDHHLTAKPGEACLTCEDDAGNVILSWKNGGNICPPVLDVSQAPNGDVVVTFVPDHIFKFNTGTGDMKKFFFEPPLGLLQDIDLFEITAADGTTSNHAYVTTVAGGIYKGDLTNGNIVSVANTKESSDDLQALAPYFVATNADGKQIFLGHTTGIKQLFTNENYQFAALIDKFTKAKGDGGDPHGFELYNGLLFYGLMSYTQIFDSSNFANNFKVYDVYYSIKLSHDKMFTVNMAPEGQPGHDYGQFSFAPINAADPKPWADVIKAALGVVGDALLIPVQPVPNIAKMTSGVALGQLTDVCGGTWDLKIPLDEICDGIDNDLDGKVDEDENGDPLSKPMDPIMGGLCEGNKMVCHHGEWVPWAKNYAPVGEVCNDGLDNDCDGVVDEGCEGCTIGDTEPCGIKIGECEPGETKCVDNGSGVGIWTETCEGFTGPVDEICGDNLDNDCDERVDENCCESKCCTTCCCCGTTYAPAPTPPTIPTPPEKEAEVEIEKEPEAVAEEAREEVPAASEEECVRKGNEWLYFDESGDLITEKRVDQMISLGLAKAKCVAPAEFDGGGILDGCSLNPSAVRIAFNPIWLGLLSLFLLRLRKRDR